MTQYTMHFQKYPHDIAQWFKHMQTRNTSGKVILLGDATGFETDIESLRKTGVHIEDRTESVSASS